ncbi:hypothetical protein B296_00042683, partial [Ensete ventricosum]
SPGFSASSFNSAFMLLHPCVCREIRKEGGGAAGFLTGDDACSECIYCSGRVVEEEEERSEVVVPSAAWRSRAAGVVKFTSVAAALPAAPMEQLRGEPINDALLVSPSTIPNPLPSFIVFLVTFAPGHICMKKTYLRIEEHRCFMRSHFWTFHSMRCNLNILAYPFISPLSLFPKQLVREELSSGCLAAGAASATFSEHPEMIYGNLFSHQLPFLQLLQGAMQAGEEAEEEEIELHLQQYQYQHESSFTSCTQESNFQLLLRLQNQNCFKQLRTAEMDTSRVVEQLESCITHASESETRGVVHHKTSATVAATGPTRSAAGVGPNERRKRKRTRQASTSKSAEEVESQRMTHIAVERNRRRLMNDHLATLRSLMPSSYVQRVRL